MAITLNKGKGLKKRFHGSKVWWQTSKVQKTCLIYSWGAISVLTAFTTICFAVSAKLGVKDDLGSHLILAWYFHSLFLKQFLPEKRSQSTKTLSFLRWQIPHKQPVPGFPISQRLPWGQNRSGFHLLLWQVRWGHGKTEKIQHFTGFIDQKGINIPNAFTFYFLHQDFFNFWKSLKIDLKGHSTLSLSLWIHKIQPLLTSSG